MRAISAGLKVSFTHQQGGWGSPVAFCRSIAQRLSPPHSGQRVASTGRRIGVFMSGWAARCDTVTCVIRLAIVAAALWAAAAAAQSPSSTPAPTPSRVPDTMAQRLLACTACHGEQGRATPDGYFPRIAGKPAAYLHNQLRHFQAGRRQAVQVAARELDTRAVAHITVLGADQQISRPMAALGLAGYKANRLVQQDGHALRLRYGRHAVEFDTLGGQHAAAEYIDHNAVDLDPAAFDVFIGFAA